MNIGKGLLKLKIWHKKIGYIEYTNIKNIDREYYNIKQYKFDEILYVTKIYVKKNHRKTGVARLLVNKIIDKAIINKKVICLDAIPFEDSIDSNTLCNFYNKCGFVRGNHPNSFYYVGI